MLPRGMFLLRRRCTIGLAQCQGECCARTEPVEMGRAGYAHINKQVFPQAPSPTMTSLRRISAILLDRCGHGCTAGQLAGRQCGSAAMACEMAGWDGMVVVGESRLVRRRAAADERTWLPLSGARLRCTVLVQRLRLRRRTRVYPTVLTAATEDTIAMTSTQYAARSTQHAVRSTQYAVRSSARTPLPRLLAVALRLGSHRRSGSRSA